MTWIETLDYARSQGRLRKLYDQIRAPDGSIDNIMQAHSLRPHTLAGHMAIYKNVLHHGANQVPKWILEMVGVYVSLLNRCTYCVDHHLAGLGSLLNDDARVATIHAALERGDLAAIGASESVVLQYARKLTVDPASVGREDLTAMREQGWDDGAILEVNQVTAYFAYANRTVLGLGCSTDGEVLGLAPSGERENDWHHG